MSGPIVGKCPESGYPCRMPADAEARGFEERDSAAPALGDVGGGRSAASAASAGGLAEIDRAIGRLAAELLETGPEALSTLVAGSITDGIPALASDPALAHEIETSTRANVLRFLSSVAAAPTEPVPADVPPEALDVARMFVRGGLELEILAHAYRRGQNAAWRRWMEASISAVPAELLPAFLDRSSERLFAYVDEVLDRMSEQVEHERKQLVGGIAARREQTVRLILEGAPVSSSAATTTLGYPVDRTHAAFVVWADSIDGAGQGDLERVAAALVRVVPGARVLMIPVGRSTLWGWLTVAGTLSSIGDGRAAGAGPPRGGRAAGALPPASVLQAGVESAAGALRVAIGSPRAGIVGFRRSHEEALGVQRLLLGAPTGFRLVAHRDVEALALMAHDRERLEAFVAEILAPLGPADPASRVLLETLRTYLAEADNAARTAARLGTHRNTILQRIAKAERLLGYRVGERRLALSVALEAWAVGV